MTRQHGSDPTDPARLCRASILDRLQHHSTVVVTDGESYPMRDAGHHREEHTTNRTPENSAKGGDFHPATSRDNNLAIDTSWKLRDR